MTLGHSFLGLAENSSANILWTCFMYLFLFDINCILLDFTEDSSFIRWYKIQDISEKLISFQDVFIFHHHHVVPLARISLTLRIDTAVWMHYMDANKTAGEEARRQLHKNTASNLEQVLAATPHKTPTIRHTCLLSQKLSKLDKPDMQDTAGEARTSS